MPIFYFLLALTRTRILPQGFSLNWWEGANNGIYYVHAKHSDTYAGTVHNTESDRSTRFVDALAVYDAWKRHGYEKRHPGLQLV